ASLSGGNSVYISAAEDLVQFIEQKIQSLSVNYARKSELVLELPEHVTLNYAFRIQPNVSPLEVNFPIQLGPLEYGRNTSVILEFKIDQLQSVEPDQIIASGRVYFEIPSKTIPIERQFIEIKRPVRNTWTKEKTPTAILTAMSRLSLYRLQEKARKEAVAGDIVLVAGLPDIYIGETICQNDDQEPLPAIQVDEPTISLNFLVNNSPFAGREGKFVTTRQIRERLEKELEVNVGLKIDFSANDYFKVYGRGELHIAILLENMRREGFELQVSQPQVIIKEADGKKLEPFEELTIDAPNEAVGMVIEKISRRRGAMQEMKVEPNHTRLIFTIPTRGFLGYRSEFVIDTKGEGILCSRVIGFQPHAGEIERRATGSMVSMATGKALGFSLYNLQDRGALYINASVEVYEGMIIGNVAKGDDLSVNPTKGKQLTNMRSKSSDEAITLTPPLELTLERGLEIMNEDEYLEVTPQSVRLRKQFLTALERTRAKR
ncbi:MAG: GTP-binding protein TypA/BipA, partial [Parcubacteria group bacterium GW2011_GWA2_42_11]